MLPVKSLLVSRDAYYDSVRAIFHSTLEVVEAKYGVVCLINDENGSPESYISHGLLPSQKAGVSVARWVASHGEPLALATQEEALLVPDLVINKSEALPLICVPIQVNGTIVGAIQSSFPSFTRREELVRKQETLKLSASMIGGVIENAVLRRKLEETRALLREMSNVSLEIQEAERERIILEIHDGIAQTLASAFQYLQTLESAGCFHEEHLKQLLVRTASLIRQAIRETRGIISSITPATLDILGLVPTLRQELRQFERQTGCQVDFRLGTWPSLPRHTEFTIYRIIHEAINNVRKHAKSPRLEVKLTQAKKRLVIRVKDWGVGFIPDKQKPRSSNRSLGLFSMRRRAEFLGGTFKINSSLSKGTKILVDIPWSTDEE